MKRRFTKAWKGDSHWFLRQLQTISFQISQGASDRLNVVADCCAIGNSETLKGFCCNWKLSHTKFLKVQSTVSTLLLIVVAIGNSETWKGCCCYRKRGVKGCCWDRKFLVMSSCNGADCLLRLHSLCHFGRAALLLGGKHVSTMQGEEWNNDDDNSKNSPCRINFFLFSLYHCSHCCECLLATANLR